MLLGWSRLQSINQSIKNYLLNLGKGLFFLFLSLFFLSSCTKHLESPIDEITKDEISSEETAIENALKLLPELEELPDFVELSYRYGEEYKKQHSDSMKIANGDSISREDIFADNFKTRNKLLLKFIDNNKQYDGKWNEVFYCLSLNQNRSKDLKYNVATKCSTINCGTIEVTGIPLHDFINGAITHINVILGNTQCPFSCSNCCVNSGSSPIIHYFYKELDQIFEGPYVRLMTNNYSYDYLTRESLYYWPTLNFNRSSVRYYIHSGYLEHILNELHSAFCSRDHDYCNGGSGGSGSGGRDGGNDSDSKPEPEQCTHNHKTCERCRNCVKLDCCVTLTRSATYTSNCGECNCWNEINGGHPKRTYARAMEQLAFMKVRGSRGIANDIERFLSDLSSSGAVMSDIYPIYDLIEREWLKLKGQYMMAIMLSMTDVYMLMVDVMFLHGITQGTFNIYRSVIGRRTGYFISQSAWAGCRNIYYEPLGKGSTAKLPGSRANVTSLKEQLMIKEIKANPNIGRHLYKIKMTDPRWLESNGWKKYTYGADTHGVEIHYLIQEGTNGVVKSIDDIKFILIK